MTTMNRTLVSAAVACMTAISLPAQARVESGRGEAELAKALSGRVSGKPVDCVSLSSVHATRIIYRTALIYEVGSTLYVNRPKSGADALDDDDILVTHTISNRLCSIDTVNLVDRTSHMPDGFVSLGQFVPYARVKRVPR